MNQKIFDDVAKQVSTICCNLDYSCRFNYELSYFFVYARCSQGGKMLLTANLIDILRGIPEVTFNSIGIGDDGRLYGLFLICCDGNSN